MRKEKRREEEGDDSKGKRRKIKDKQKTEVRRT
jgi:hypothetical protein